MLTLSLLSRMEAAMSVTMIFVTCIKLSLWHSLVIFGCIITFKYKAKCFVGMKLGCEIYPDVLSSVNLQHIQQRTQIMALKNI